MQFAGDVCSCHDTLNHPDMFLSTACHLHVITWLARLFQNSVTSDVTGYLIIAIPADLYSPSRHAFACCAVVHTWTKQRVHTGRHSAWLEYILSNKGVYRQLQTLQMHDLLASTWHLLLKFNWGCNVRICTLIEPRLCMYTTRSHCCDELCYFLCR